MTDLGSAVPGLILIAIGIVFYFIPSMVAQGHRNAGAIFALNFFLGWTIVGWVGALVWAIVVQRGPALKDLRPCPACAQQILKQAYKCPHCSTVIPPPLHAGVA